MAKYTVEEKYKMCMTALEHYKNPDLTFVMACKRAGVKPYNVLKWMEQEGFVRVKHKYLAVNDMRVKLRSEAKVALASKILEKGIDAHDLETVTTIAKFNSEGRPIPQYLKRSKRQVGPNVNAALRLLEIYDKRKSPSFDEELDRFVKEYGLGGSNLDKVNYIKLDDDTILEI